MTNMRSLHFFSHCILKTQRCVGVSPRTLLPTLVSILLTSPSLALPISPPAPMYGLNAANSGQSQYVAFESAPQIAWQRQVFGDSYYPRALSLDANGTLFTPGNYGRYALNAADGSVVWTASRGRDSTSALDGLGHVYAFEGGRFTARQADTGQLLWHGASTPVSDGEPIKIGPEGTIYAPDIRGLISAYEPGGALKWQSQEYGLIQYGEAAIIPAIDGVGNLYFGSGRGLVSLDPQGVQRWLIPFTHLASSRVIIGPDGLVYYSADGQLFTRNPANGQIVRQRSTAFDSLQAIGSDGTLFFTSNGAITATDLTGALRWQYRREWIDWPLVVDAAGKVIGATQQGDILALSSSGQKLWEIKVTDAYPVLYSCAPIIGPNGAVFALTRHGVVSIVPEPSTFVLVASSLLGLSLIPRRRQRC